MADFLRSSTNYKPTIFQTSEPGNPIRFSFYGYLNDFNDPTLYFKLTAEEAAWFNERLCVLDLAVVYYDSTDAAAVDRWLRLMMYPGTSETKYGTPRIGTHETTYLKEACPFYGPCYLKMVCASTYPIMRVDVAGYAATDDINININGRLFNAQPLVVDQTSIPQPQPVIVEKVYGSDKWPWPLIKRA